ncbi:MAG TPA: hypothetical protein VGW31_10440 [Hanamia sp.]|nr:hypothetical protein [Hanamia sp.]
MAFYLNFGWMSFCIVFGAMLLLNYLMSFQSKNFYTKHVVIRKFSMLDLEFPASPAELVIYIKGIFQLPGGLAKKTLNALRGQLYFDFIFMLVMYSSIFILCMKVSMKLTSFGHGLFAFFAWLLFIPLLCNIVENIYLLNKIRPEPVVSKPAVHKSYQIIQMGKWVIALTAVVCSLAAIFYFWLIGRYSYDSLNYLVIIVAEIIIFFILKKSMAKSDKEKLEEFQEKGSE